MFTKMSPSKVWSFPFARSPRTEPPASPPTASTKIHSAPPSTIAFPLLRINRAILRSFRCPASRTIALFAASTWLPPLSRPTNAPVPSRTPVNSPKNMAKLLRGFSHPVRVRAFWSIPADSLPLIATPMRPFRSPCNKARPRVGPISAKAWWMRFCRA